MSFLSRVLHHNAEKSTSRASSPAHRKEAAPYSLQIRLELPPVVLYGDPRESTGCIISGILTLDVHPPRTRRNTDPPLPPDSGLLPVSSRGLTPVSSARSLASLRSDAVTVDSVVLSLVQTVHYTKPFLVPSTLIQLCKNCATRKNVLARWDVLPQSLSCPVGPHAYPFSHLLPGLVAALTKLGGPSSHSFVKYDLVAVATTGLKKTTAVLPLDVLRSILRGPDRNSLRIFPPTEMTASAVLPGVMYPKSTFPIELRLDNVVSLKLDRRWRMRKLLWKIEEHTQVRASACSHHQAKLTAIEEAKRKQHLAKTLRTGQLPGAGSPDGPSRSVGMHHLTINTLVYIGSYSSDQHTIQPPASAAPPTNGAAQGDQDVVVDVEEAPTNRISDEVVRFEEDFGLGGNNTSNSANEQAAAEAAALVEESKEALFVDELRVIAHGEVKSGWKSDFSGTGRIELVAEISALNCSTGPRSYTLKASSTGTLPDEMTEGLRNDANISCDISDPALGLFVGHVLMIEVIVAEEVASKPAQGSVNNDMGLMPVNSTNSVGSMSGNLVGVPTGAARVLRMQFKIVVTERSGLGIAWDDEVPPTYEDVRALSPPNYETLSTGSPFSPLTARPTPAVLYGVGETPDVGLFATTSQVTNGDLDEEFML